MHMTTLSTVVKNRNHVKYCTISSLILYIGWRGAQTVQYHAKNDLDCCCYISDIFYLVINRL
uniref:Uncharacterized protein n=1 Tax=Anguilla anguilla TaxID=7936 RepID=A0A0E9WY86_ANGAN